MTDYINNDEGNLYIKSRLVCIEHVIEKLQVKKSAGYVKDRNQIRVQIV